MIKFPKVEKALNDKNWTRNHLSVKAGISASEIYTALAGQRPMFPGYRKKISAALGIPEEELFPEEKGVSETGTIVHQGQIWFINRVGSDDSKPRQGVDVLLRMKDGQIHEGRWLRNANKWEQNVRRWRIYKLNKYVDEDEVKEWKELE